MRIFKEEKRYALGRLYRKGVSSKDSTIGNYINNRVIKSVYIPTIIIIMLYCGKFCMKLNINYGLKYY